MKAKQEEEGERPKTRSTSKGFGERNTRYQHIDEEEERQALKTPLLPNSTTNKAADDEIIQET